MVRLKGDDSTMFTYDPKVFQFQYGSIKSNTHKVMPTPSSVFQFQYGSIKSSFQLITTSQIFFISIPIWFDR